MWDSPDIKCLFGGSIWPAEDDRALGEAADVGNGVDRF